MKKLLVLLITLLLAFALSSCESANISNDYVPEAETTPHEAAIDEDIAQPADDLYDFEIWQLFTDLHIDYIWLTNASGTIEPQKLREGDKFLDLTLESIRAIGIENVTSNVEICFSGDLVLSGDLTIHAEFFNSFAPHKQHFNALPYLAYAISQEFVFSLDRDAALLELLNLEPMSENMVFENITVRIGGIYVFSYEGRSHPHATIIEIIDLGS